MPIALSFSYTLFPGMGLKCLFKWSIFTCKFAHGVLLKIGKSNNGFVNIFCILFLTFVYVICVYIFIYKYMYVYVCIMCV